MPLGEAKSDASFAMHGKHIMLLLHGMDGHPLYRCIDPAPARDALRVPDGDPFWDTGRPLRLALASDIRWAQRERELLVRLSVFPGVEVNAFPGVDDGGFKTVRRIFIREKGPELLAGTEGSRTQYAAYLNPAWLSDGMPLPAVFGTAGKRLSLDIELHESIGFDYLVSTYTAAVRENSRLAAYHRRGLCTPEEALRMVGAKAAMYRFLPIYARPGYTATLNVGMWRDEAVMGLVPALQLALQGALAPNAVHWQKASVGHLSAIRSRLVDLLVARDDCFRLLRRDALDSEEVRRRGHDFSASEPATGPLGNDLLQLLAYHAFAALNYSFAIGDNLAWIMLWYAGVPLNEDDRVGFPAFLNRKEWRSNGRVQTLRALLAALPETEELLTLRDVRNLAMHRDGMENGRVVARVEELHEMGRRVRGRNDLEFFGLWVLGQGNRRLYNRMESLADYSSPEIRVVTFRTLVERTLVSTTRVLATALGALPPGDPNWIRTEEGYREFASRRRMWSSDRLKLLWGFQ